MSTTTHDSVPTETGTAEAAAREGEGREGQLGADLGLSREDMLEMYSLMAITRAIDERMWVLNRAGKIPFVISGQGRLAQCLGKGRVRMDRRTDLPRGGL